MKSSCTGKLPNLPMLHSDSNKTQTTPNVNNVSLFSIVKLRYENYGEILTKNQCTFHKDNTPIMISAWNACDKFKTAYV